MWCHVMCDSHTSHKSWQKHDICHIVVIYITVTQLCDIKKDVEDSGIDDVIYRLLLQLKDLRVGQ